MRQQVRLVSPVHQPPSGAASPRQFPRFGFGVGKFAAGRALPVPLCNSDYGPITEFFWEFHDASALARVTQILRGAGFDVSQPYKTQDADTWRIRIAKVHAV